MAHICVAGGGPAGSTFAARMAQLGHDVTLVEQAEFPRPHLGESLTPGVMPLLRSIGADGRIENAGFPRVRKVHVKWEGEVRDRQFDDGKNERGQGRLVDRGIFDEVLLRHAASQGVRVLQPARVLNAHRGLAEVASAAGKTQINADYFADATGRATRFGKRRDLVGCRTVALYAYWRGRSVSAEPHIEAGEQTWYWGVPLPDGSYNALVFVDAQHFRKSAPASAEMRYVELLQSSSVRPGDAELAGPVRAVDASSWLRHDSVSEWQITIGDAAISLDPISSSGVQKAIQSALAAAVVVNTILRRPSSADIATQFYRSNLLDTSRRHAAWAASHYRAVADACGTAFWIARSKSADPEPSAQVQRAPATNSARVSVSSLARLNPVPCLEGEFVTQKLALEHPGLQSPVAYLAGLEIAPLLQRVHAGMTAIELAILWSDRVPPQTALRIANWLAEHGILVPQSSVQREHCA